MANQDYFPWEETPDQDVLEAGNYLMKGVKLEDGQAGTGKRMFSCQMQVEQPENAKGMTLFENFVTGVEEDPLSLVPSALGTRRMKKMLKSAQIPAGNSVALMCKTFEGSLLGVTVSKFEEKDGEYKGQLRNRIGAFWKVGERQPGVDASAGAGKGPAAASAGAGVVGAPPGVQQPSMGMPPMGAGMPPGTGAPHMVGQPAPVQQPQSMGMSQTIGQPMGQPAPITNQPGPAPVQQGVPFGSSPPVQPGGAAVATVECGICHQQVPVVELTQHVAQCAQAIGIS